MDVEQLITSKLPNFRSLIDQAIEEMSKEKDIPIAQLAKSAKTAGMLKELTASHIIIKFRELISLGQTPHDFRNLLIQFGLPVDKITKNTFESIMKYIEMFFDLCRQK